jgi:NADH dehydrogenase FAD-containing subunit
MILSNLLKAMANNDVNITIIDTGDNVLIKFAAPGYASVESDLTSRVVKKIKIESVTSVLVYVDDALPSV